MKKTLSNRGELVKSSSLFLQSNSLIESYLHTIQQEGIIDKAKSGIEYAKHSLSTINQNTTLMQKAPLIGLFAMPGSTEILGTTFYTYNYMKSILAKEGEKCKKLHGEEGMIKVTECIDNARKKLLETRVSKLNTLKPKCKKTRFPDKCLQKIDELIHDLEEKIKNIKVLIF